MIKKGASIKISIFILSSILSFILLEISYRYIIFGRDSLNYEKMNSVAPLGLSGLIEPSRDREIVYQLKPNLHTYFKMARFKTNSKGLRDKEYSMAKPKNTIRVAVVGDSLTMPAGVKIEDAYHSILEEEFNTSCHGKNYEFINFAVGGYYLSQYWAVIRDKVMKWDPDMILIGFDQYNDYELPPYELFERAYKVKDKGHPFFFQSFAIMGIKQLIKKVVHRDSQNNRGMNGKSMFTEEQVDYMNKVFSNIGAFSKENNIPIVVANLGITPNEHKEFESIATSSGLYYVDLTDSFDGTTISQYSIYQTDNHPNSEAQLIFANNLKEYIDKAKLLECNNNNFDRLVR
jgi:hypothetical protein